MDTITTRILENGNLEITIPIALRSLRGRKHVVAPDAEADGHDAILTALARGLRWQRLIDEGRISSAKALAAKIGRDQSYVANIIGMVQISPKIIHAVIRGDYPKTLTLATLKRKLPDLWSEQEAMLLGEN